MATKILSNTKEFSPVKIEIEFVTRSQLAAFIALMANPNHIGCELANYGAATLHANRMNETDFSEAIDSLIDSKTLGDLIDFVDN